MGCVAIRPTFGSILVLPPGLKPGGPHTRLVLCSQPVHFWATSDSAPRCEAVGTPEDKGYVATRPTYGPPPILPPALKRSGPPKRHGLCSHLAQLRATSDSTPRFEAVGSPQAVGVM